MAGYTKLFSSITDSTIWREPDRTRLVWITMLAMADANGIVQASIPGLADRSRVPLEDCLKALDAFMSEDKWSRSKEYAGRRIAEVDGGWALLNHAKYRAVQDAENRKEQSRLAMRRLRSERAGVSAVNTGDGRLTQAEAEAEADATPKADASMGVPPIPPQSPTAPSGKPARKRAVKPIGGGVLAWGGYSSAYGRRYGVEPVRNASVNAKLALFAGKLSEHEAAEVAAFYVGHQNRLYVGAMHPVDLMLRDAERLRTEWATGRTVTATQAGMADKTQTNFNAFAPLLEEARKRDQQKEPT